ncbi:MAG: efflux RND transporter periplasmic adaptor subunit [Betaproteobacteria bacterium HGW-Betaproteobacteria-11]|nr:MAG: efflux RND transporter periplasmic adaptor subunit [Betaproteobacteria bacterium HGW-Betaproteobacteria-11]
MKKNPPLLGALLVVFAAACSEPPAPPAPPKVVRTQKVGAGETAVGRLYSGEIRARYETTVGFRVPGKLVARLVDAGTVVKAGQPLARIDVDDARLQSSQAAAQAALALAEARRYRELRARNFVSQAALDVREAALTAAQAQAGLAQNQMAYAALAAPRGGLISAVLAETGQVVAAGQPVFRLAPDGDREVAIDVAESEIGRVKPGMDAEVALWAANGKDSTAKFAGKVREVSPLADSLTRTYAVRISLPAADARLPLGLTARVRFPGLDAQDAAVYLPLSAIYQQGDEKMAVWIVGADHTVSLRPVKVVELDERGARVTAGLAAGEMIVAAGASRLTAGEKVRLAEPVK